MEEHAWCLYDVLPGGLEGLKGKGLGEVVSEEGDRGGRAWCLMDWQGAEGLI